MSKTKLIHMFLKAHSPALGEDGESGLDEAQGNFKVWLGSTSILEW